MYENDSIGPLSYRLIKELEDERKLWESIVKPGDWVLCTMARHFSFSRWRYQTKNSFYQVKEAHPYGGTVICNGDYFTVGGTAKCKKYENIYLGSSITIRDGVVVWKPSYVRAKTVALHLRRFKKQL